MDAESLFNLVKDIQASAKTLQNFLEANNSAAESTRFPDNAPDEVFKARNDLINQAQALHATAQGPTEYLKWQASVSQDLMPIQWVFRFDIATKVPLEGEISYSELAAAAKVDQRILQRVLRIAMLSAGLFREIRSDYISHSPASRLLATDAGLRGLLAFELDILTPALSRTVDAHEKWNFSLGATHTGFNLALDCADVPFYQYVSEHPDKRDALDKAFVEYAKTYGWQPRHLLTSFDFASLPAGGKVVDIGGSRGQNSIYLARKFSELRFIVQDLAGAIAKGKDNLSEDLKDRIEFQVYDFYTPQPITDAALYYIQNVFTDQSDENAIKVLQNVSQAMRQAGAKLILREPVLPEPGTIPPEDELRIRRFDFRAMCIENSGHRTAEEWQRLVAKAGGGLKIVQVRRPEHSLHTVIVLDILT